MKKILVFRGENSSHIGGRSWRQGHEKFAAGSRKKSAARQAQPAVVPAENKKKKIQKESNLSGAFGWHLSATKERNIVKKSCSLSNAFDGRGGQDIEIDSN